MIPRHLTFGSRFALAMALTGFLCASILCPPTASAADTSRLAGALEGRVSDDAGLPQMGAVVAIYNRQDKLLDRALTDGGGFFSFAGLAPDLYSIRVTLATFLPAVRNEIQIQTGKSSLLDVNMAGLFSSIRLLPPSKNSSGVANEDWKWVLRSSGGTRPVFRYLPQIPAPTKVSSSRPAAPIFSDTQGLVAVSAGDMSSGTVGTAFAFSTSVLGSNNVQFAGDVGYAATTAAPSAAFRTTYSRDFGMASPDVSVTMRQLYVPRLSGVAPSAGGAPVGGLPPLRTVSVSTGDRTELTKNIDLEYGFEVDSVSFLDRIHYFSPYARVTYTLPNSGEFDLAFTSGNARPQLGEKELGDENLDSSLQRDVATLGDVPHVTTRSHAMKVQRGQDVEAGYSQKIGSRVVRVSAYRESVQNAALMLAGATGANFGGDLIPDLYSDSKLFNAGNYHSMGYTTSVAQKLGDNYEVTVMYGSVGVLAPRSDELTTNSPNELRALIHSVQRQAVTARISGAVKQSGTRFVASYQFLDDRSATSGHLYSTDYNQPEPGLNAQIRQQIPQIFGMPRMEAVVDLRNLLAEGYLPITLADGSQVLLVHTPRSLRGGLNFRF